MKSYVYILTEKNKNLVKIGKSNDPITRIKTLSNSYCFDINECFVIETEDERSAYAIETSLHNLFDYERNIQHGEGGTEFFNNCITEDIDTIVDILSKNNDCTVDRDYFKRYFVGVDVPMFVPNTKNEIIKRMAFDLGSRCRSLRLNCNITQDQLAEITSLSIGTIQSAEQGKVKLENLITIMSALGDDSLLEVFNSIAVPLRNRAR